MAWTERGSLQGPKGDKGDVGEPGPRGLQGIQGEQGLRGETGGTGPTGGTGDKGDTGPKGDKGDTGDQGPKGDKGDKGDRGYQGLEGARANMIMPTIGAPSTSTGRAGDYAIDKIAMVLYGPKNSDDTWPPGVPMSGPQGPEGPGLLDFGPTLPAPGQLNRYFYHYTTSILYRDTGAEWEVVAATTTGQVNTYAENNTDPLQIWRRADGQQSAMMHPQGRIQLGATMDTNEWAAPVDGVGYAKVAALSGGPTTVPLIVRANTEGTGQTADLTQWQNDDGDVALARVTSAGVLVGANLPAGLDLSVFTKALTAYSPVFSAETVGTNTLSPSQPTMGTGGLRQGYYLRLGKMVWVNIRLIFGTGAKLGSGYYRISLPVPAAGGAQMLPGMLYSAGQGANRWPLSGSLDDDTIDRSALGYGATWGSDNPGYAPGNGDMVVFTGWYWT